MSRPVQVPAELGAVLGPLVQDSSNPCPVAKFGRMILSEWESQGKERGINEIVASVADSCLAQEEEMGLQIEQCRIAKDKLASELQRVESQLANAQRKVKEAKEYRNFCKSVQSGLIDLNGLSHFTQPPAAMANPNEPQTARHAPPSYAPSTNTSVVAAQEQQRNGGGEQGNAEFHMDPNAPPTRSQSGGNSDAGGGVTNDMQQLISLLQIQDVKEATLSSALARCESSCHSMIDSPWSSTGEYETAAHLQSKINDHMLKPRPPLQITELRISQHLFRRYLMQGKPKDSRCEFLDAIDTEHGVVVVTGKLLESVNDDVKTEALLLLADTLRKGGDQAKVAFASSGALRPLVTVVETSNSEQTLEYALGVVYCVASRDDIREAIRKLNGVQPIVELLYSDQIHILENAINALGILTREEGCKTLMRECSGLEKLVATLYHPNEIVVSKAAGVIWNCAQDKESRLALRNLGAIPQLLELMRLNNDAVAENVAGALWNITADPDHRDLIPQFNGILPLVRALSSKKDAVVENASGTLWNCSSTKPGRIAIRHCDGLKETLKLLTHPALAVQENGSGIIRNCAINDQCKLALRELGAVELFLDLIKGVSVEIQDKLLSTLWIMTTDNENKQAVRLANGFPVLLEMLQTVPDELLEKVLGIFRGCAQAKENRPAMCAAGVAGRIADLRQKDRICRPTVTSKARECAAGTLWQLAQEEKALIRREGGISLIGTLLSDNNDEVLEQATGAIYSLTNSEAENRDVVRDVGVLDKLLGLLKDSATTVTSTNSGIKPINVFVLHNILMAIRNSTSSNAINQRLAAEAGAIPALLTLIRVHQRTTSPPDAPGGMNNTTPDDIIRECLRCIKNIASERKGATDMQAQGGVELVRSVMDSRTEDDNVKKAGLMALQSLSRLVRI